MDLARLKYSWDQVAAHGEQVPMYFYSLLFLSHPETRSMFPTHMAGQRDRLFSALGHIVSNVAEIEQLSGFLRGLGADHRKFGVEEAHYPAVGEALLGTLQHFLREHWTEDLAADWAAAYNLVAQVMIEAAAEAEQTSPPYWVGEVIAYERRGFDVAVFTLRPDYRLPFVPGQSIGVSLPVNRTWRYYSPANAPRTDGTLEFHVRAAPGGVVSSRLVYGTKVGDQLHLSSPIGDLLTLNQAGDSDLLLLCSGTGWAPLKALVEQVATEPGSRRRVDVFVGARSRFEMYDGEAMDKLASSHPWLNITPVLSMDPMRQGERMHVVDRALAEGDWRSRHVYVCGSDGMVSNSLSDLRRAGYHDGQLHYEGFGDHWYGPEFRAQGSGADTRNSSFGLPGGVR